MCLGLHTVVSLERCPLFRVSLIEGFHCIAIFVQVRTYYVYYACY